MGARYPANETCVALGAIAFSLSVFAGVSCTNAVTGDAGFPDSGSETPDAGEMPDAGLDAGQPPFRLALSVDPFTEVLFAAGFTFTDGVTTATDVDSPPIALCRPWRQRGLRAHLDGEGAHGISR